MSGMDEDENSPSDIDWGEFRTGYVRLETGVPRKLKLTGWRHESRFERPGLRFYVLEEDSVQVDKTFSVTSKRLIQALRPIIQKAEKQKRKALSVSILRTGEGMDTSYEVKEEA